MKFKSDDLMKEFKLAQEYVGKIGKPQLHFRDGSVGKWASISVKTEIHHQANSGNQNYWNDTTFDAYLRQVIEKNIKQLAQEALELFEIDVDKAILSEENELKERLQEIEHIKAKGFVND